MDRKFFDMSAEEVIAELKRQYADDEEALEVIARSEADLEYVKSEKFKGSQTPEQYILGLADFLFTWY